MSKTRKTVDVRDVRQVDRSYTSEQMFWTRHCVTLCRTFSSLVTPFKRFVTHFVRMFETVLLINKPVTSYFYKTYFELIA